VERVSTVDYYANKQCLIGFITERGESRCSVCAVTMPNCSADKGLKAVPIRGVSESPPSWRSINCTGQGYILCNLGQCSRLEHSVQSRRRHAMATESAQSIQNTCTASNNIIDVGSH